MPSGLLGMIALSTTAMQSVSTRASAPAPVSRLYWPNR